MILIISLRLSTLEKVRKDVGWGFILQDSLDRYDYSINLAEFSKDRILKGANFVLEFVKEG